MKNDGYTISFKDGQPHTIEHAKCGTVSYNPHDIAHRYCPRCHLFLDLFIPFEGPGLGDLILDALKWPKEDW